MCCRISKLGVAQGPRVTRAWPTRCCCEHTHVCFRKKTHSFKVAPKDQRLYGIGRRTATASIHMCVWQNHISTQGLHRGSKRCKSWADQILLRPGAAASTHICVSAKKKPRSFKVAPKDQRLYGVGGRTAAVTYTCVCGRITCQLKACTKDQKGTRVWPTNCCEHTHMCARNSSRLHPRITGYTGLADQLREYVKSRLHPRAKGYKCLADCVLL